MEKIRIRLLHETTYALTLLLGMPIVVILYVNISYLFFSGWYLIVLYLLLAGIPIYLFRYYGTNIFVEISEGQLIMHYPFGIKRHKKLSQILMVELYEYKYGNKKMVIKTNHGINILKCLSENQADEFNQLLRALIVNTKTKLTLVEPSRIIQRPKNRNPIIRYIQYINPVHKGSFILKLYKDNNRYSCQLGFSFIGFLLFCYLILPHYENFLHNYTFSQKYDIETDGVYFQNKKIEGANPSQFIAFDLDVGKDSMNVYCRGRAVPDINVSTFRKIGYSRIYGDTNYVYIIGKRVFPPSNELKFVEGIDRASFVNVGEHYKDKYNFYISNHKYPYLLKAEIPKNIDLENLTYNPRKRRYISMGNEYTYSRQKHTLVPVDN